jgi:hypothetical protein
MNELSPSELDLVAAGTLPSLTINAPTIGIALNIALPLEVNIAVLSFNVHQGGGITIGQTGSA